MNNRISQKSKISGNSCFLSGITGDVNIDENGDRIADYSLLDMDPETSKFEVDKLQKILIEINYSTIFPMYYRVLYNLSYKIIVKMIR